MFIRYKYFAGIYHAILVTILIIGLGTCGYVLIEGWSFFDSFYMTIITITTVGFSEVNALSDAGRAFTAFLIISSFGTIAYAVSLITSYIATGKYKQFQHELVNNKHLRKMEGHTIICGYGRVGKQAAGELIYQGKSVVVIEKSEEVMEKMAGDVLFVYGDSTSDEALIKAGIHKAGALITALPADTDNLFVVLSAHELNPALKIISRASDQSSVKKLRVAGADNVIMPDLVGGAHMASLIVTPDIMEFLDLIKVGGKSSVNLEEISFNQLPSEVQSLTLAELESKLKSGCNIIGFRNANGEYKINPDPDTILEKGAKLFVLGSREQIKKLNQQFGI